MPLAGPVPRVAKALAAAVEKNSGAIIDAKMNIYFIKQRLDEEYATPIKLTTKNIQTIPRGFQITIDNVTQHLSGIKIRGRVINTQAVHREGIEFRITVAGKSNTFVINRISCREQYRFLGVRARCARFCQDGNDRGAGRHDSLQGPLIQARHCSGAGGPFLSDAPMETASPIPYPFYRPGVASDGSGNRPTRDYGAHCAAARLLGGTAPGHLHRRCGVVGGGVRGYSG